MPTNIPKKPLSDAEKAANHWQSLVNKTKPPRLDVPSGSALANQPQASGIDIYEAIANRKLYSGLVFTCQIANLPEGTFQVTQFDLHEGLSELFTLTIQAVSPLPNIDFKRVLGDKCSLTVMREGIVTRKIEGLLASVEQGNTDGVKTWYQFVIRPEMWVMTLKQDSRIFQNTTVPKVLNTLLSTINEN